MTRKHVVLVVLVALIAVTAGCSGTAIELGDGTDDGTSTKSNAEFPAGFSDGGMLSGDGINHSVAPQTFRDAAKTTGSYTFNSTSTVYQMGDGEKRWRVKKSGEEVYQKRVVTFPEITTTRTTESYWESGSAEKAYWRYEHVNEGANVEGVRYAHTRANGAAISAGREGYAELNGMVSNFSPSMVILYAGARSFSYEGTTTLHGERVHEYSFDHIQRDDPRERFATIHSVDEISTIEGSVWIDQDGLVRKLDYTFESPQGSGSGEFTVTEVGSTTDAQPGWLAEAEDKALEISELDITEDYIKISFSQGETINGGYVSFVPSPATDRKTTVEFDASFGGGDTIYITNHGEERGAELTLENPQGGLVNDDFNKIRIKTEDSVLALDIWYGTKTKRID